MCIADQVILQVFLLLGLSGQLKIYVIGEFREVAEAFLSTANAIPRETWRSKQIVNISNLPPNSSSGNNTVRETLTSHVLCHQPGNCRGQRSPVGFHWPRGQEGCTSDGRRTKKILVMGMGSGKLRRWNLLRGILKACTESEEASRTRAVPFDCLH